MVKRAFSYSICGSPREIDLVRYTGLPFENAMIVAMVSICCDFDSIPMGTLAD